MSPLLIKKEIKKLAILESSYSFFIKEGIRKSSLESLLKHLNMGKGTFYHYFDSKDQLVKELIFGLVDEYIKHCEKNLLKYKRHDEKLKLLFDLYLVDSKANIEFLKLYKEYLTLYANSNFEKQNSTFQRYILVKLENIYKEEIKKENIKEQSKALFHSLGAVADGMLIYSFLIEDFNLHKEFKNYFNNLLKLIKKEPN